MEEVKAALATREEAKKEAEQRQQMIDQEVRRQVDAIIGAKAGRVKELDEKIRNRERQLRELHQALVSQGTLVNTIG